MFSELADYTFLTTNDRPRVNFLHYRRWADRNTPNGRKGTNIINRCWAIILIITLWADNVATRPDLTSEGDFPMAYFTHIGQTISTKGNAHIVTEVNITAIRSAISDARRTIFSAYSLAGITKAHFSLGTGSSIQTPEAGTRIQQLNKMDDALRTLQMFDKGVTATGRSKRFDPFTLASGIIGLGFNIYSTVRLEQIVAKQQTMQDALDHTMIRVTAHDKMLEKITIAQSALRATIMTIDQEVATMEAHRIVMASIDDQLAEIQTSVDRATAAMAAAMMHRTSTTLLSTEELLRAARDLDREVTKQGYRVLTSEIQQIYQCSTSILFTDAGFTIITHIPTGRQDDMLQLYRYNSIPILLDNDTLFYTRPENDVLAISDHIDNDEQRYQLLQEAHLAGCEKLGTTYACDHSNVARKMSGLDRHEDGNCIIHIFKSDEEAIAKHCVGEITPLKDDAIDLGDNTFLFLNKRNHGGKVICTDPPSYKDFTARMVMVKQLQSSCTAHTDTYEATASTDISIQVQGRTVYWPDQNLHKLMRGLEEDSQTSARDLADRLKDVIFDKKEAMEYERHALTYHDQITYGIIGGLGLVLIILTLAGCYGCYRYREIIKSTTGRVVEEAGKVVEKAYALVNPQPTVSPQQGATAPPASNPYSIRWAWS
jgi:hypothetical protein